MSDSNNPQNVPDINAVVQGISKEEQLQMLKELCAQSPLIAKAIAKQLQPPLQNRQRPYYSAKAAESVRRLLDLILKDQKDLLIKYKDYPHMAPRTIKQKLHDGMLWLSENDPTEDKKYAVLIQRIVIKTLPYAFQIHLKDGPNVELPDDDFAVVHTIDPNSGEAAKIEATNMQERTDDWKKEVTTFIQEGKEALLKLIGLELSHADMEFVQILLKDTDFEIHTMTESVLIIVNNTLLPE